MSVLSLMHLVTFLPLLFTGTVTSAAKILVIPIYHYSHVNLFGIAGTALSSSGHDVTLMLSSMFDEVPRKLKLKALMYEISKDTRIQIKIDELIEHKKNITFFYRMVTEVIPLFGKV